MTDQNLLATLKSLTTTLKNQQKFDKAERINKIISERHEFAVRIKYLDHVKFQDRKTYEIIYIEGIENTVNLFKQYRQMGHSLHIKTLQLVAGKNDLHTVNFKYKNF